MVIPYFLIALYLGLYWLSFVQGGQLYFGEAVSYEGLLRLLQGAPFATPPTSVPVSLTPYTPLFLLPLQVLVKNIPMQSFWSVVTAARVFQTALLFLLFFSIQKINARFFRNDEPTKFFWWAVLMVFAYSPVMEMALRPDTCSFICEVWGVYWVLHFLEKRKNLSLVAGAVLFTAAAAVKLNTLGAVSGSVLYLTFRKEWKGALTLGVLFTVSLLATCWLFEKSIGPAFSQNILVSIQSRLWNVQEAVEVYKKVFDFFLFPLLFFIFLVGWGLGIHPKKAENQLLTSVLGCSFMLAFLGQLKWGAFHNYFLGAIYLGTVPASFAIAELSKKAPRLAATAVFGFIGLLLVRGLSIPEKMYRDRAFVKNSIQWEREVRERVPEGFLYVPEERLHLMLTDRTAIGVLTEELLGTTPKFENKVPELQKNVAEQGGYAGFLIDCEQQPPTELGFSPEEHSSRFQMDKYCLYYRGLKKDKFVRADIK